MKISNTSFPIKQNVYLCIPLIVANINKPLRLCVMYFRQQYPTRTAIKCNSTVPGNSREMKSLFASLVLVAVISIAKTQTNVPKTGACPPALPVQFCGRSCYVDAHCAGIGKCCPTQCGGSICSMPVTMTQPSQTGE